MKKRLFFVTLAGLSILATGAIAQVKNFAPVTQAMLLNPSPDDWLMYSRTYDAQRYSPLNQINKSNVSKLALAWKNDLAPGTIEIIPIVHNGVMYVEVPVKDNDMTKTAVQALDATNGSLIWEYRRPTGGAARPKTLGIFEDIVIFAAPDNVIVGLDAATAAPCAGKRRRQGASRREPSSSATKSSPAAHATARARIASSRPTMHALEESLAILHGRRIRRSHRRRQLGRRARSGTHRVHLGTGRIL